MALHFWYLFLYIMGTDVRLGFPADRTGGARLVGVEVGFQVEVVPPVGVDVVGPVVGWDVAGKFIGPQSIVTSRTGLAILVLLTPSLSTC